MYVNFRRLIEVLIQETMANQDAVDISPNTCKHSPTSLVDVCDSGGGNSSEYESSTSASDASDDPHKEVKSQGQHSDTAISVGIVEYEHPARMLFFIVVAMSAQTFRGFQPGFRRYLQLTANFQALELASFRNGLVATFLGEFTVFQLLCDLAE